MLLILPNFREVRSLFGRHARASFAAGHRLAGGRFPGSFYAVKGLSVLLEIAALVWLARVIAPGFLMLFSANRFPGANFHLEWVREEMDGNVYVWREQDLEGWLCPALLKYFDKAPQDLFVQLKTVEG